MEHMVSRKGIVPEDILFMIKSPTGEGGKFSMY